MIPFPSPYTKDIMAQRKQLLLQSFNDQSDRSMAAILFGVIHKDLLEDKDKIKKNLRTKSRLNVLKPICKRQWHEFSVLMSASRQQLMASLESGDEQVIIKNLEDFVLEDKVSEDGVQAVVPSCVTLLQHHNIRIRSNAIAVIAKLMREQNIAIVHYTGDIGRGVGQSTALHNLKEGEEEGEIFLLLHRDLCWVIGELQKRFPGKVVAHFNPLMRYLLGALESECTEVQTAACQYWADLKTPQPVPLKYLDKWVAAVHPKLPKIVAGFMNAMEYTEEHVKYLESKTQDQAQQFRPKTVSKEMERYVSRRNFAATGLESVSKVFGEEVVASLKMNIIKRLQSDDWRKHEAALLALAAFTNGVGVGVPSMADMYPDLLATILVSFQHPEPLVRSIACFTMQNFVTFKPNGAPKNMLSKSIKKCLLLLDDNSMEVQEMALRLMAAFLAQNTQETVNHLPKIIAKLQEIEPKLYGVLRYSLYECFEHLFGQHNIHIATDVSLHLSEPLISHWERWDLGGLARDNPDEISMLCRPICIAAMALKGGFMKHNRTILSKASDFFKTVLTKTDNTLQSDPVAITLIGYLDIISAMYEGQGKELLPFIADYKLTQLALDLAKKTELDERVRQGAMALLGHCCQYGFDNEIESAGHTAELIATIEKQLETKNDDVRGTALWVLTHIANNCGKPVDRLFLLANQLSDMFMNTRADENVVINSALALTNLAVKWPDVMCRVMLKDDIFVHLFALMQTPFPRDAEKILLFSNICDIYNSQVTAIAPVLWTHFCVAAAMLDVPSETLHEKVKNLLRDVRKHVGNAWWNKINTQIGKQLSVALRKKYKLY